MRLLEFQAKRIFSEHSIPVPRGVLVKPATDPNELVYPVVLKAQVPVGGRGKAGGIQIVSSAAEAADVIDQLFNTAITGHLIRTLLAEEKVEVKQELYLAILIDKRAKRPLIIASSAGGGDIEQIARQHSERIAKCHIDPVVGLAEHSLRRLAGQLGLTDDLRAFQHIVRMVLDIFRTHDATLVEINPLGVTPNGLLALDAKLLLDDKAAYRHADLFARLKREQADTLKQTKLEPEQLAEAAGVSYVALSGDVGLISDGAGTGMLTLDLIEDAGGQPANFCELGGFAGTDSMRDALGIVLANPRVKVLLISLIGGLTRMDEVADGFLKYLEQHDLSIPLVVRMCGTQEEVGREKLRSAGIEAFDDLPAAVRAAVDYAKGQ